MTALQLNCLGYLKIGLERTPPRLLRVAVVKQDMTLPKTAPVDLKVLTKDLRAGSRAALARAITLIESRRRDHQAAGRMINAIGIRA